MEPFSFPGLIPFIPYASAPCGDLFSRLLSALQVPTAAWREQPCREERKVAAGARGVGGEAGIRVSGRREQAGTRRLSKLILEATPESRPSCPARFSLFLPHSFAWDYTVPGLSLLSGVGPTSNWLNQCVADDSLDAFRPSLCSRSICQQLAIFTDVLAVVRYRRRPGSPRHAPSAAPSHGGDVQIIITLLSARNSGCPGDP